MKRTYVQILEDDYNIIIEHTRRDESMVLAAEKYASHQPVPQQTGGEQGDDKDILIEKLRRSVGRSGEDYLLEIDRKDKCIKVLNDEIENLKLSLHPSPTAPVPQQTDKLPLEWSPVESEKQWQKEQFKKLFPNIENDQPDWQRLNFFLDAGLKAIQPQQAGGYSLDKIKDLIDKARTYNDGWVFTEEELIASLHPSPTAPSDAKSNDWHLGNISRVKEMAEIQNNLNDFKEECERLAGLVTFWQNKYNELATPFVPGKIDNNPLA